MAKKGIVGVLAVIFALGMIMVAFIEYKPAAPPPPVEKEPRAETAQPPSESSSPHSDQASEQKTYLVDMAAIPQVIAIVNGSKVDKKPFIRILSGIQKQMAGQGRPFTEQDYDSIKTKFMENIINVYLLSQEADAKGIKADEKAVNEAIAKFESQYTDKEHLKAQLDKEGVTMDDLRAEVTRGFKINKFLEEVVLADIKASDAQVRQVYDENISDFKRPKSVKARHILLNLAPDADDETVKKVEAKMDDVVAKLKKGEKFDELAKQYSDGPSKNKGGDLGFFSTGNMVKEFEDVAFSLKPGDAPKKVRSRFGLHLVETTDVKEAGTESFEEVKEKLKLNIESNEKNKLMKGFISNLREKAEIKVLL